MVMNPEIQEQADTETENSTAESPNWFRRHRNILIFSGLAAIYLLPFMTFFNSSLLESGAVRLLHGAVFARDFVELLGPGTFWWNALFMRIFGADFFGARVGLYVTSLGTGIALYYLGKQVLTRYAWLPPVLFVATYFGAMWPLMSHHTVSNFFSLLTIVCVLLWFDRKQSAWLWIAGFLAAYTSYTLQPKGLFLYFAVVAWMAVLFLQKKISFRPIFTLTASYAVSMGAGLLYFWSQGALWDLIYANLIWPATSYSTVNDVPYGWGTMKKWHTFSQTAHGVNVFSVFAPILTAPYFLIDALPFLLAILIALRWKDALKPKILLFLLCGGAIWLSEIHRKDLGRLASGSLLLLVVFIYFLQEYKAKFANLAVQLIEISGVSLAAVNFMLMLGTHPMHTRAGTVRVYKSFPVVSYLEKHTKPGDYTFCFQYCPEYYFLDDLRDATRYSLLNYNYNTEAQFKEAIRSIQEHKVKYVVWQGGKALQAIYQGLPGSDKRPPYGFIMDDYLHAHYHEVKAFSNGMQIWERNGDG